MVPHPALSPPHRAPHHLLATLTQPTKPHKSIWKSLRLWCLHQRRMKSQRKKFWISGLVKTSICVSDGINRDAVAHPSIFPSDSLLLHIILTFLFLPFEHVWLHHELVSMSICHIIKSLDLYVSKCMHPLLYPSIHPAIVLDALGDAISWHLTIVINLCVTECVSNGSINTPICKITSTLTTWENKNWFRPGHVCGCVCSMCAHMPSCVCLVMQ